MLKKAGIVVVVAIALALVAPAASPVQISYVTSDSMEPAIQTNDGYILVPAGEVIPGEIVTFYSEERGAYVTHRVVGTTPGGYLTQGDANPSTDQATGDPPVEGEAIAGQVLTVGGQVVVIPQLGAGITFISDHWLLLLTLLGLSIVVRALRSKSDGAGRAGKQSVLNSRQVVVPTILMAIIASVLLISMGAVHTELTYSVTETEVDGPQELAIGENRTVKLNADIATTPFTTMLIDSKGMTIVNKTRPNATAATNATALAARTNQPGMFSKLREKFIKTSARTINADIPAQAEIGAHMTRISLYPYPATLPKGVLTQLHAVHPWIAALGSVLVVFIPGYLLYWLLIDTTTPIRGSRRRWLHRLGER